MGAIAVAQLTRALEGRARPSGGINTQSHNGLCSVSEGGALIDVFQTFGFQKDDLSSVLFIKLTAEAFCEG